MQNNPLSHGLWEATAPPAPPSVPLLGSVAADVAVVGCGYTGLAAALRLAEGGARVVALEAVEVGFGGAGRNVGYVNAGTWVLPSELPKALGPDYGERALKLLGDSPAAVWEIIDKHSIDCDPIRNGTLHCAVGVSGLRNLEERARQWSARGAPVKVLSREETEKRTGAVGYAGPLLDMRAGTIQPLAYARGLARAAIAAGATIHTQSPVLATERADGKWSLTARQGKVTADWVVVATDAYGDGASWAEALRREQIRVPYFNFATSPLAPEKQQEILPRREGCWDTKDIMTYFRFDRDGRLLFGSVGSLLGTGDAVHRAWAERAMKKLFPRLGPVSFEHQWFGMIGMTANYLPRFHYLADKVVTFCGYNGRGIGPGTVFGRVIAEHILGLVAEKDLPLPVTSPEKRALPTLREAYYSAGAQIAHAAGGWL